jgi:YegS/Rv2252/BmrU family lipid kinase
MTPPRFIFIVNPRGGIQRGLQVLDEVRPRFAAAGSEMEVYVTKAAGHAAELARSLDQSNCHGLCLIGGDGTIHEVVNGLLTREIAVSVPLGIIPAGTGNSIARHLGYLNPEQAVESILAGRTQPLDVARLTLPDRIIYSVNIVGWGSGVDVNRTAERLRKIGRPRYTLAALWHILYCRRRRAILVLDNQVSEDDFLLVIACNTKYTGKGMKLAPRADLSDGKIDVVVVRQASRRQMVQLFRGVFTGSHLGLSCVEYYQVRSFRIETAAPQLLNLDGELKGCSPVSAEMIPAALRVFA